jgi:hypothetical protein
VRVESYRDLRARTSRSEREDAVLVPRPGLLSCGPERSDREEGELYLEARASGEGRMCQIGSRTEVILAAESFTLPARPTVWRIGESCQRFVNISLRKEIE